MTILVTGCRCRCSRYYKSRRSQGGESDRGAAACFLKGINEPGSWCSESTGKKGIPKTKQKQNRARACVCGSPRKPSASAKTQKGTPLKTNTASRGRKAKDSRRANTVYLSPKSHLRIVQSSRASSPIGCGGEDGAVRSRMRAWEAGSCGPRRGMALKHRAGRQVPGKLFYGGFVFAYMHYFTVDNYARVARSLTRARRSVLVRARLQGYLHDCRSRQAMCTPLPLLLRSRSSTVILLQPHQPPTPKKQKKLPNHSS